MQLNNNFKLEYFLTSPGLNGEFLTENALLKSFFPFQKGLTFGQESLQDTGYWICHGPRVYPICCPDILKKTCASEEGGKITF